MCRTRSALTLAFVLLAPARALAQPAPDAPPPPDDPPLLGPMPTSSSGTDLVAPAPPPAPRARAEGGGARRANDAERDERIRELEQRVASDERRLRRLEERSKLWEHLKFESFIQPQLLVQTYNSAASPNVQANGELPTGVGANDTIAKLDGTTTNGTFFRVRRARLRTFYETDVARLFLQLDALPAGGFGPGIGTILRNAEATGIVRWTRDVRTELTAGLFFTPFRRELLEASLVRPFIERTWFIQNVFPTERDYGLHAKTIAWGERLVVDLAIVNGQRLGERTFVALPDLNKSKDVIAYASYRVGPATLGASGYLGRGQVIDASSLRLRQFGRWAVNVEASAAHRLVKSLGESRLTAELTFARNMDAGVIYPFAVPRVSTSARDDVVDLDQRALYVRLEQDLGRRVSLGYRYDMYTPDADLKDNARDTHAFLVVWKLSPNLRFMSELGWAIDNVHPSAATAPSKHIVYSSHVLQAMF